MSEIIQREAVTPPIKTVEDLSKSIINDPEKEKQFHRYVQEKFGLESENEILDVTQEELDLMKKELSGQKDGDFSVIGKHVYEDYLETQLNEKSFEAVTLDNATKGIESARFEEMKSYFESHFESVFQNFDFLPPAQKELLKLGLANRLLSSDLMGLSQQITEGFSSKIVKVKDIVNSGEYQNILDVFDDTEKVVEQGSMLEGSLANIIQPYVDKFTEVNQYIQINYPNLSQEEKQNIISHVEWFQKPSEIEQGVEGLIIEEIDFTKTERSLQDFDVEDLKQYVLKSREDISKLSEKLQYGDKMQEYTLQLINNEHIGSTFKKILSGLFKIPFIGKIIASFLGFHGENPMLSLEIMSSQYKMFDSLLGSGKTEDKNGEIIEGDGVFKSIDFGEQDFQDNKGNIGKIQKISGSLDQKKSQIFWQQTFSEEGYQVGGVVLQFSGLNDPDNFENGKLKNGKLKEILELGIIQFENDKGVLELETANTERMKEEEIRQNKISELTGEKGQLEVEKKEGQIKIEGITSISSTRRMEELEEWDDWLNYGDITDVTISDIKEGSIDDYENIVQKEIGEEIHTLRSEDKEIIGLLCNEIKRYFGKNQVPKGVTTIGDLYEEMDGVTHDFFSYLDAEKQKIENENIILSKQIDSKEKELLKLDITIPEPELFKRELYQVGVGNLSQGINFGVNNDKILQFNTQSQELLIDKQTFAISNSSNIEFNDIEVSEGSIVFHVLGKRISTSKITGIEFLAQSVFNNEEVNQFQNGKHTITFTRKKA
ncbi:hypothetical protein A9Q91_06010 [Candidatus Gracilibacteria bacterium 28_42_T64]|nr:hypothetical protein A9Q91_06010 [Candidatus Gracilibacteria bacterium 28_42_T64]